MIQERAYCLFLYKLFFILLTSVQLHAQLLYSDYKQEQKKIILDEQFDSNKNGWPSGTVIQNGVLISDTKTFAFRDNPQSIPISIDRTKDFELEMMISSKNFNYVYVMLDKDGWKFNLGSYYVVKNGKFPGGVFGETQYKAFLISTEGFNKITIRKVGTSYYLFINEQFVGKSKVDAEDLKQLTRVGFSGKMNVDFLKISYLFNVKDIENQNPITNPVRTNTNSDGLEINKIKDGGKYFALIIGVANYDDPKMKLEHPTNDAFKLKEVLLNRYTFTDSTTFLVLNPTRQKLMSELFRLRKIIGPNDNLLIFYAGHGHWDEDARQGYWWPKDATTEDPSNWLSNSDLREQIRSIKSAHTLLISDACFSGGIFKTRSGAEIMNASKDIQLLYKMPSRRAMTSGTLTTVPDKSVFLEYLCKRLNENQAKFMSSQYLFDSFRAAVINNSNVVPQDGVIAETGDEGGDFIFILKNK